MHNSGIKYKGEVTIKVKGKPPVKSSNTGTIDLFVAVCSILGRKYNNLNDVFLNTPAYMKIKKVDSEEYVTLSRMPIITRDVIQLDNNTCTVTLSALVSATNIATLTVEGDSMSPYKVELFGGDDKLYAHSEIEYNIENFIKDSYAQATISWDMTFSNAANDTTTQEE